MIYYLGSAKREYKILYNSNDPTISKLQKLSIELNYSFRIKSDVSGKEILNEIKTNHYDAIISDYESLDLNGIELLKKVRASGSDIPFILAINTGQEEVAIEALNDGADSYIRKDLKPEIWLAKIDTFIQKSVSKKNIQASSDNSSTQYEKIQENVPLAIIVIDKSTHKIISINPAALAMIGRTEDQVLGQECHGIICPAKRGECPFIDYGKAFNQTESTLLKENGEHLDILKTIVPMQIQDNTYLIATIFKRSDTTCSKDGQELPVLIQDGQNQTQTECPICDPGIEDSIRFLPHDIFVVNKDKQVIAWNKAIEEMTGIPAHDIIGKNEYQIPFFREDQPNLIDMVLDGKQNPGDDYLSFNCDNGVISAELFSSYMARGKGMYLSCIAYPVFDETGHIIAAVESLRDISKYIEENNNLKELTENLEQQVEKRTEELQSINGSLHTKIKELVKTEKAMTLANKKLNLLNSITRHDILNQLTVIYGYLEIIGDSLEEGAVKDELKAIEIAGKRINDLISFTRLFQDIGTRPPIWQDLNECFDRATLGRVPDSISCSSKVEGINLFADPLLEKVFYNLVDNSLRHGGGLTQIRLFHRSSNDELILIYEDNGVGVDIDQKEKIFKRGYGKNTGLGLFLIREILDISGMSIIETGELGKGARFEIHIPIGK